MRLGLMIGYAGSTIQLPIAMIQEADRLGYFAVWSAEAYGSDAVTPLAWVGAQTQQIRLGTAIMQMPARTPAMTAMTAMTLDQLSGGRMLLGLGLSGPQVVEGWHGQPYGKPLGRTREYVGILRRIFARTEPLVYKGVHYQIPYTGADATGLGKPLKSILHGRADLPIYLAAIGPGNVALAAEIADGWLPIFFAPQHYDTIFKAHVEAGLAAAGHGKSLAHFDIAPTVSVVVGEDVVACRNLLKPMLALYIGGMGAKGKNFYHDLVSRYGFADAADAIQTLYLSGRKEEAIATVPDALVDAIALCGPKARIRERLALWQRSPITTMNITAFGMDAVRVMAELVLDAKAERSVHVAPKQHSLPTSTPTQKQEPIMTVEEIFTAIAERFTADPGLASQVNARYQFQLSDVGKSWVVDLKDGHNSVTPGTVENADCTIAMNSADFIALSQRKLDPTTAFMQGKVKISGNMMLATKLQQVLG